MYYRSYHNHNKYQFKVEKSFFSIALSSVIGKTKIKINLHNNISFALHFFLNIYRLNNIVPKKNGKCETSISLEWP